MNTTPDAYEAIRLRLASCVRRIRTSKGLTQEAAADRAGLAVRHFQKIEAAEVNVTLNSLARIAAALQVDVSDLLGEKNGEEAH
jgi:transcriptional regulator with XRE-family HTH domain